MRAKKKSGANPGLAVSDRVQLTGIRLVRCKCERKPVAAKSKRFYNITTSTEVSPDREKSQLVVVVNFHLRAFHEEDARRPVLTIEVSFVLAYELPSFDGLTQEGFDQFADFNGVFNAWPYWREFVQNTVARMGLPPLTVPVFRIMPKERKEKTKKDVKTRRQNSQANV